MLDIRLIREKTDFVRQTLATRGAGDEKKIDEVLALDERRRKALTEVESLKAARNRVSKEIGALMAQKKAEEAEAKKKETRELGEKIAALDKLTAESEQQRDALMLQLPNLPNKPREDRAIGGRITRRCGLGARRPHLISKRGRMWSFANRCGLWILRGLRRFRGRDFCFTRAGGHGWKRALIQFLLDLHVSEHGYTEVSPPFLVNRDCMVGVGQFPKFADQYYGVQEGNDTATLGKLFLIPTAETPVANIHRDEILKESQLPIRYCAYTPCFRGEAGAAGVGTRGMIRVHQFDKVELIKITLPENGYAELEALVANAERVLQLLGLHYRVVQLCTGDMGFASAMTYDIEVWAPGQGQYLEVSSCSNCEDFQARRMNLRYKTESGENKFPHILNGSGTALARLFVALVETHQQADGSLAIPEALRPFLKTERISAP